MGESSMNACSARSTGPTDAGRRPRKCGRASLLFQLPLFSRWLQGMASTKSKLQSSGAKRWEATDATLGDLSTETHVARLLHAEGGN